jgi:hypothetical protein
MSMTLILWKGPQVGEPEEAERLLAPYYESGDDSAFEPNRSISEAAEELRQLYPDDDSSLVEEDCPWSDRGDQTDRLLVLTMRWSAADEVLFEIERLAGEHDLVLYDPQGPEIYLPRETVRHDGSPEPPGFKANLMAAAVTLVGALLIALGWKLSIPVLNWLLIGVGIFILGVGLTLIYAFIVVPRQEAREGGARGEP